MDASNIIFDSDLTMLININQQSDEINLKISDSLEASEEALSFPYKERIATFINSSDVWHKLALEKLVKEEKNVIARLMTIYILSEQNVESLIFGLLFRVEHDIEHGRGMKISGGNFEIFEYGLGDIAFV
jgi:hypothetical protein